MPNIGSGLGIVNRLPANRYHKLIAGQTKTYILAGNKEKVMRRISDVAAATTRLASFIRTFTEQAGYSRLVIGLSGGVDSALSAVLGAKAIGPGNILGLIMPYRDSSPESEADAVDLAAGFGIKTEKIDITPMIEAYFGDRSVSILRRGNKMARERMAILFDIAARDGALVLGTSNKTETCLGYATWYGDAACSLNPIGGLYKRDIREMAAYLGLPRKIIDKNPTADLWPGQTDEGELGITYELADMILQRMVEEGERSLSRLTASGAQEASVRMIVERINRFAYKRALPATDLLDGAAVPSHVILE